MKKYLNELLPDALNQGSQVFMSTGIYTCSMHPEIKSDKPGKCPKCGMELVQQN